MIFEGRLSLETQDSGHSMIGYVGDETGNTEETFVRLHSWSSTKNHHEILALEGKRIRVTVEVLDK